MNKWDERFLELAKHIASWSKDPRTKVGAVIVRPDKTIMSLGYNGLPRGVPDDPELLSSRDYKLARTVHAEMNAILNCATRPEGCTIYVWPIPPCSHCAAAIIQAGITTVVSPPITEDSQWHESCRITGEMFEQSNVKHTTV
jgi:dCMP deaminase